MGLSSKQVSSDGLDWSQTLLQARNLELHQPKNPPIRRQQQQNQQQSEPLKCPRCDSANTKFCYYNNYNKSQPRHFCKTCKRHWTKGGTLRNVPVGGGRKNKRLKTSKTTTNKNTATTSTPNSTTSTDKNGHVINRVSPHMAKAIQQKQSSNLPPPLGHDQKSISGIPYQPLATPLPSVLQETSINCSYFLGASNLPQSHQDLHFPYSSSSMLNSFQSSNVYNFNTGEAMEDSTITGIMPVTRGSTIISTTQAWPVPNTSSSMEYWNWEDIGNFVSADINLSWDGDSEIKP